MAGHRKNLDALKAELSEVETKISEHPLASPPIQHAQDIIENNKSRDQAAISRELAENGLPAPAQLGKVQVSGSASWWMLHRKKNKFETKIAQAQSE